MHPLIEKVNDRSIKASGTQYQDWTTISKATIVDAFGKGDLDDEWIIQFKNGVVANIYSQGKSAASHDIWHIGGFNRFASIMVLMILNKQDKHDAIYEIFQVKA